MNGLNLIDQSNRVSTITLRHAEKGCHLIEHPGAIPRIGEAGHDSRHGELVRFDAQLRGCPSRVLPFDQPFELFRRVHDGAILAGPRDARIGPQGRLSRQPTPTQQEAA